MGVSGQLHGLTALHPGKAVLIATEYKAGWVPQPAWMLWIINKSTVPAANEVTIPEMSSPKHSHYTNYAIAAPNGM
jgi:hypothetical protein